jgi:hypothetical protein
VGDLTIKDITREVTLDAEFLGFGPALEDRTTMAFEAKTSINREDWDMTWNVVVEAGNFLWARRSIWRSPSRPIWRSKEGAGCHSPSGERQRPARA